MPNLDLAPVRAAIKAKLASVAGMGQVHDYERYAREAAAFLALYKSAAQGGDRLYGWFVSERRISERFVAQGRYHALVDWSLTAYMGLNDADATEKLLAAQVDLARDAFRADDELGGAVSTCIIENRGNAAGLQLDELAPVTLAGALAHRARCSLATLIYF